MIIIRFSDVDWLDVDAKILKMSIEDKLMVNARLTYDYTPPVITEDSWNGITRPVQKNIWESYIIEFAVKEVGIHALAKMQSCQNITIQDTATNEIITVDTSVNGGISLEGGDRYLSANKSFNLVCRSNKISTYPGIAKLNTNNIRIVKNNITYNFYTDMELIYSVSDAKLEKASNKEGLNYVSKSFSENIIQVLFYLKNPDAMNLKLLVENLGYTSLIINPSSDNIVITEIGECKLTQLTEGLYRCECKFIINANLLFTQQA